MRLMLSTIGFVALFLFLAVGVLSPNPFGNNPDTIVDESYFLTSSLSAIEKGTLPGWEFSYSGSYYGGPQVYIDTAVLVPVIGVLFATQHFSILDTKLWVALHTGDLLHFLRLANGVLALAVLAACIWYFRKRNIPRPLVLQLALFLTLLLSNVLFMEFLHTAKVWVLYNLVVAVGSAFFFAQEYYLRQEGKPFLTKEVYAAVLMWCGVLAFFQNYFGVFSIALLAGYALYLGHLQFGDLLSALRRNWYWIVLVALTQISFLYRAVVINGYASFHNMSAEVGGVIDWSGRLIKPLLYAVAGDPFVLLYPVFVLILAYVFYTRRTTFSSNSWRMILVALIHPVLIYIFFHIGAGLSIAPRYGILLTMACGFSLTIFAYEFGRRVTLALLAASTVLCLAITMHSIVLYWHPSSEAVLLNTLMQRYNSPHNVFVTDVSALRLTLPLNERSLAALDSRRGGFERFQFLAQYPELVRNSIDFRPLVFTTYGSAEEASVLARFSTSTEAVWLISTDCARVCSVGELAAGSCFAFHLEACGISPQEVNGLPTFFSMSDLGRSYIVRRVH